MSPSLFYDLLESECKDSPPAFDLCTCWDCDWKGNPADCQQEEESDGWETPPYMVDICPECGGVIGDYEYSDSMIDEVNKYYGVMDEC